MGNTFVDVDLPPSGKDSYYDFTVYAENNAADNVGSLHIYAMDGVSDFYRFRVK